ncbi:hypothetical protein N39L_17140 [Limnospira platensis NIES-39]|jgi:hypothetical protein|uniref:Integral membrane sensor signal transduction histidine kinase n=1 Tax=Limnospira platensis NIES-46 TaxID=1236695 RepID=A0A5M3T5B3_LIMPL|nr:hypothetical protein N39L_17140 [Arthrospira platensis NIES-39]GCE92689.1 integral membrane sensor signal transduction histidine kinase [Arthrospira platensis NIES-46]
MQEVPAPEIYVLGNESQLYRLVSNLIANAIQYTRHSRGSGCEFNGARSHGFNYSPRYRDWHGRSPPQLEFLRDFIGWIAIALAQLGEPD